MTWPVFSLLPVCAVLPAAETLDGVRFGAAVCVLDDLDEDGAPELAVGAPLTHAPDKHQGSVFILSGATREVLLCIDGKQRGDGIGESLRTLHDLDGDGVRELLAGHLHGRRTSVVSPVSGEVLHVVDVPAQRVASLEFGGSPALYVSGSEGPRVLATGGEVLWSHPVLDAAGDDWVRDFDDDGFPDVLRVGTAGTATIYLGRAGDRIGPFPLAARPRPTAVEPAGDLDGDGVREVLVGLPNYHTVVVLPLDPHDPPAEPRRLVRPEVDDFGHAVLAPGDLDGDGHSDFVVGGPGVLGHGIVGAFSGETLEPIWKHVPPGFDRAGVALALVLGPDEGLRILSSGCDYLDHGPDVYRDGNVRLLDRNGELLWEMHAKSLRWLDAPSAEAGANDDR